MMSRYDVDITLRGDSFMTKLWRSLLQILSGLAVFIVLAMAVVFALYVLVPLFWYYYGLRSVASSLFSLVCSVALAGLTQFLFKKLCHEARLAWWTACLCNFALLLFTIHAFWFAYHYRNDWERTDGDFGSFLAILSCAVTTLCSAVLLLPMTRKYCGVSRS
jgi:hypothetical protein